MNALLENVKRRGASLEEYAQKLQGKQAEFSEATVRWAAKKKSNNDDLEMLSRAIIDWRHRYNDFVFQSETYERLKKQAPGSQMCEVISRPETDQALRSAAQCLQWLWDGAPR